MTFAGERLVSAAKNARSIASAIQWGWAGCAGKFKAHLVPLNINANVRSVCGQYMYVTGRHVAGRCKACEREYERRSIANLGAAAPTNSTEQFNQSHPTQPQAEGGGL